jgi:hypothetical protein
MKEKILLFVLLSYGLFFVFGNLVDSQTYAEKEASFGKIEIFSNDSHLGNKPVVTAQCYQVMIPDGLEVETSLIWANPSSETGVSGIDLKDGIACFVLNPGEAKWLFTKVKSSSEKKSASEIKYKLLKKVFSPAIYSNQESIDAHKKPVPRLI